jgi:hypothetical protein
MSLFDFLGGMASGTADYVTSERKRARELEDADLKFQIDTVKAMANRDDFDSRDFVRAMEAISQAQSGSKNRKLKPGKAGFMGQSEMSPLGQMIGAIVHGDPNRHVQGQGHPRDVQVQPENMLYNGMDPNVAIAANQQARGLIPPPELTVSQVEGPPTPPAAAPMTVPQVEQAPPQPLPAMTDMDVSQVPRGVNQQKFAGAAAQLGQDQAQAAEPVPNGVGAAPPSPMQQGPPTGYQPLHSQAAIDGAGTGSALFNDQQMNMRAENKAFSARSSQEHGEVEGRRRAWLSMGGTDEEFRKMEQQKMRGRVLQPVSHTVMATDPRTGVKARMQALFDPNNPHAGYTTFDGISLPDAMRASIAGTGVKQMFDAKGVMWEYDYGTGQAVARTGPNGEVLGKPMVAKVQASGTDLFLIDPVTQQTSPLTEAGTNRPMPAPATAQQKEQVVGNEASLDTLSIIESLYNPKYVGPLVGRAYLAGQQVPGLEQDAIFAEFAAEVATNRNTVIKAITGAQMGEPEADRIRQQIPDISNPPAVFLARMKATKRNMENMNRIIQGRAKKPAAGLTPPPGTTPAAGGTVNMRAPDGTVKPVPADKVDFYKSKGATVVQ